MFQKNRYFGTILVYIMDELARQVVNRWHLLQGGEEKLWAHFQNLNNTTFISLLILWQKWIRAVEVLQNQIVTEEFAYTVNTTVSLEHSIQFYI